MSRAAIRCALLGLIGGLMPTVCDSAIEAAPVPKPTREARLEAALKALVEALPPPEKPAFTGTEEQWAAAAKRMKIAFPTEYKRFVQMFGWVVVNRYLIFHTPIEEGEYCGLLERTDFYRKYAADGELVWPTEGGILPIGTTPNAHTLAYRCKGAPDEWTIAIVRKSGEAEDHPFGLIEFMTRLANGKLESKLWLEQKEMHPPLSFK